MAPGNRSRVEKLWREFFSNPSEWRDHRVGKVNARSLDFTNEKTSDWPDQRLEEGNSRFPDFKHKKRHESLWLDSKWNPPWVEAKLAAIATGTIELSSFAWNEVLSRYSKAGQHERTMELYQEMLQVGQKADRFTFFPVLRSCASLGDLEEGLCIHTLIIQTGLQWDLFLGTSLIDMYGKCGSIEDAKRVFNELPERNVATWNAMILGYVKCGEGRQAMKLYQQMQCKGMKPNTVTLAAVLNACASLAALEEGRHIHKEIIQRGYEADIFVSCCLVDMYGKCGSIEDAERVFIQMVKRNMVAWNAMILAYVKCGQGQQALELYRHMQQAGMNADPVTFVAVLNACACEGALEEGRQVHEAIIERGYEGNVFVGNSLVDMYAKCGSREDAERVFNKMPTKTLVTWNAMILGYVKYGEGQQALKLYQQMLQEGVNPDHVTFVAILNACACIGALEEGRHIHKEIVENGFDANLFVENSLVDMYAKFGSIQDAERVFNSMPTRTVVTWNAMLDMYAKCGSLAEAERVFCKMPTRDIVTWNAMILGYVKCRKGQQALELYKQMLGEGFDPNPVTFMAVLNACACAAALGEGRNLHEKIIQRGYEANVFLGNSLIDMYSKCGSVEDAERVFNQMPTRNVVTWNAMLAGYARHGYCKEAVEHFEQLCYAVQVNDVTFISLLSACSHGGLVDDGLEYFRSMSTIYNISPTREHFTCVVDLLGRAGRLREAEDLIMSTDPDSTVWLSLLSACRAHGDVEMGEHCAERVLELDPENSAGFVLLSNVYAAVGT